MPSLKGTPIGVDDFTYREGVFVFFLSHFHSDHLKGLTPSWDLGTIYCTELTRRFAIEKYSIEEKNIKSIPLNTPTQIKIDKVNQEKMTVTLIDANHCPGSCMFLFEGYFGTILHTGDFRFDGDYLTSSSLVKYAGKIDRIYLDDTYADRKKKPDFPPREEVGNEIIEIIKTVCKDDTLIVVAIDTLGKEELLVQIANLAKSLVVVTNERFRSIEILYSETNIPHVFTTRKAQGRIVALGKREVTRPNLAKLIRNHPTRCSNVVGIYPSGLFCSTYYKKKERNKGKIPENEGMYRLPYTLHSSYPELLKFLKFYRPRELYSASKHDNVELRRAMGHLCDPNAGTDHGKDFSVGKIGIPRSVVFAMKRKSMELSGNSRNRRKKISERELKRRLRHKNRYRGSGLKIRDQVDLSGIDELVSVLGSSEEEEEEEEEIGPPPLPSKIEQVIVSDEDEDEEEEEIDKEEFGERETVNIFSSGEESMMVRPPPPEGGGVFRKRTLPQSFFMDFEKENKGKRKKKRRKFEPFSPERNGKRNRMKIERKRKKKMKMRMRTKQGKEKTKKKIKKKKRKREDEFIDPRGKRKKRKCLETIIIN